MFWHQSLHFSENWLTFTCAHQQPMWHDTPPKPQKQLRSEKNVSSQKTTQLSKKLIECGPRKRTWTTHATKSSVMSLDRAELFFSVLDTPPTKMSKKAEWESPKTWVTLFTPKHDLFAPPCKRTTEELSFYGHTTASCQILLLSWLWCSAP